MQMAQNAKCYHVLFTDRTSVKVPHSLYGHRGLMQLSHVSEEVTKCRIRTPVTVPPLLWG